MGDIGVGKTYIFTGLLNFLLSKGRTCKYVTEHEIIELHEQKNFDKYNSFKFCEFLVIDEIGKRSLAQWQFPYLENLVSNRYDNMLPTFFITNLSEDNFKKLAGDRLTDRMRDNKVVRFSMNGKSLRGVER